MLEGNAYGQRPFTPPGGWAGELADTPFALLCPANDSGVALDAALAATLTRHRARIADRGNAGSGR